MSIGTAITIALVVLLVIFIVLYFFGRRAQKKQEATQDQIAQTTQQISMFVIDKKIMRLMDAGLPEAATVNANFITKRAKVPVLRAKVGSQVMNLVCERDTFDRVPVKKEVKAMVSGIYVTSVKSMHGKQDALPEVKKSWFRRLSDKIQEKGGAAPVKSK